MKTQNQKQALCSFRKEPFASALLFLVVLFSNYSSVAQVSYNGNCCAIGGIANTGIGLNVMSTVTGNANTGLGEGALQNVGTSSIIGDNNTAVGFNALNLTDSPNNTAVGANALLSNSSGGGNTACGVYALGLSATTNQNTAIGLNAMGNSTGSYNSGLGAYADTPGGNDNATAIGSNAVVNASDKVRLGDAGVTVIEGQPTSYSGISDGRFKTNIKADDVKGLDFIKRLRPVGYNFDTKKYQEHIVKGMPESYRKIQMSRDYSKASAIRQSGFIAQEVEQAAKDAGYDFNAINKPQNDNDTYSLAYGSFVVPIVKAMQEQQKMIEQQQQRIDALEKSNNDLLNKIANPNGIDQFNSSIEEFKMEQNIPNPFTNETVVKYNLPPSISKAYMAIYDLSGKQITTLPITEKGASQIILTSEKLSAGIYIYSIVGDGKIMDSKRMVISEK